MDQLEQNQAEEWVSAHLYYAEITDTFLTDCVAPFVRKHQAEEQITCFFFIRYWERGPHIRLRLKTAQPNLIREKLTVYVQMYYDRHPSGLSANQSRKDWFPSNSIQFLAYKPEVKRYGGLPATLVAEKVFEASSNAVLNILSLQQEDAYSSLGKAIQLHLIFVHAMGMDIDMARLFFNRLFTNWLPKAYYYPEHKETAEVLNQKKQAVLDAFDKSYLSQKAQLAPWIKSIWQALNNLSAFDELWIEELYKSVQSTRNQLSQLQESGLLENPEMFAYQKVIDGPTHVLWSIYDSYIHMTNNRLGILNRDEGYLGYLLMRGLD